MAHEVEIVLGLLVLVAAIVAASRKIPVPYPVLLVLGGLVLALVPGLPPIRLAPELVFLLFLPPLLYWESLTASLTDLRANLRSILLLAVGLVLVTTAVVAWVAHKIIPGLTWPAAFVLGAILAPTDEVAVTEVANRLSIPRRVLSILEGESLINDAVSLVAYRMAIAAAVTGLFSWRSASVQFLKVGIGGVLVGLAVGWGIAWLRSRVQDDPPVENTISLLTPFAAYLPAEALGVSGVLAVVTIGLYLSQQGPRIVSSRTRLQAGAVWEMITFLLNGLLFILTGLQLRLLLDEGASGLNVAVIGYAGVIVLAILLVRIVWVFANTYLPRLLSAHRRENDPSPPWQSVLIVAWTGIRGGLSLVTALAIPLTLAGGHPFPGRGLLISIAFCVILATLLLQGLSLPWLLRRFPISEDDSLEHEETKARLVATRAALAHLDRVSGQRPPGENDSEAPEETSPPLSPELLADLRTHYTHKTDLYASRLKGEDGDGTQARAEAHRNLRQELLQTQRDEILRLWDEGKINDDTLRRIQHDLDLEEARLQPPQES